MRPAKRILEPESSFLITNMMKGVIDRGTGRRARALRRPAAGKTGTTNNQVDAWFIGYTSQILTGVWTGRDVPSPMGKQETGSRAALPTWLAIDRKTGKLAGPNTGSPLLEAFKQGSAPVEITDPGQETVDENGDFFDSNL